MGYDDNENLAAAARHEAGHALACIAVGGSNVRAVVQDGSPASGQTDPPQHLHDDDIDRVFVYAAGLVAQSSLGMAIEIDGVLNDIGRVWSTLAANRRGVTGEPDPDFKELLLWALVVGGVTSQFLGVVWNDLIRIARLLADDSGTHLTVDELVDVAVIRDAYTKCRAGLVC